MESTTTKCLMALGLLAGLMIGTGHIGGGLAVAVAAGAGRLRRNLMMSLAVGRRAAN